MKKKLIFEMKYKTDNTGHYITTTLCESLCFISVGSSKSNRLKFMLRRICLQTEQRGCFRTCQTLRHTSRRCLTSLEWKMAFLFSLKRWKGDGWALSGCQGESARATGPLPEALFAHWPSTLMGEICKALWYLLFCLYLVFHLQHF